MYNWVLDIISAPAGADPALVEIAGAILILVTSAFLYIVAALIGRVVRK